MIWRSWSSSLAPSSNAASSWVSHRSEAARQDRRWAWDDRAAGPSGGGRGGASLSGGRSRGRGQMAGGVRGRDRSCLVGGVKRGGRII